MLSVIEFTDLISPVFSSKVIMYKHVNKKIEFFPKISIKVTEESQGNRKIA